MQIESFFQELLVLDWFRVLFKLVTILFTLGYLIYTLIYYQQVIKMGRNVLIFYHQLANPHHTGSSSKKPLIVAFAILQILFGVSLLLLSLFFL